MTSLAQRRQPLQVLSMANRAEPRRRSKRIAGGDMYDEQDGDFLFTRGSKRQKTSEKENVDSAPAPVSARKTTVSKKASAPAPKKRPLSPLDETAKSAETERAAAQPPKKIARRPAREPSPVVDDEPLVVPKKRGRGRPKALAATAKEDAIEARESRAQDEAEADETNVDKDDEDAQNHDRISRTAQSPAPLPRKIALPLSDTPINYRNKEFRKKGGKGGGDGQRRSSLGGQRGRRASSLIENGSSAIPHREVSPAEFYKHIEASGLTEPRRMKQLLTWCGERALSEKPPLGTMNSNAILGARAIQDQLLKDFATNAEFSNWFNREDDDVGKPLAPARQVVVKPNPKNIELDDRLQELEEKVKRLKAEKASWEALRQPIPQIDPLFLENGRPRPPSPNHDDDTLLDAEDAKIAADVARNPTESSALRADARTRLAHLQSVLEFKIDLFADGVHKLDQRVVTAGRQADKVLALSSTRLKARDERERSAARTRELPMMEVLRSLGNILPREGE